MDQFNSDGGWDSVCKAGNFFVNVGGLLAFYLGYRENISLRLGHCSRCCSIFFLLWFIMHEFFVTASLMQVVSMFLTVYAQYSTIRTKRSVTESG